MVCRKCCPADDGFLREHQFIHTICDEPQAGVGSVPFYPVVTANKALIRIHGRNIHGWRNTGNAENWRKVRFLYDYNREELQQLGHRMKSLNQRSMNSSYYLIIIQVTMQRKMRRSYKLC